MTSITRTYHQLDNSYLQDFYSIEIVERELPEVERHYETGTSVLVKSEKIVYFNSRIHKNKRVMIQPLFSGLFTDAAILQDRDLVTNILRKYSSDIFA